MALHATQDRFEDHVVLDRDLVFSEEAASSAIKVFFDHRGFVVADAGQSKVREYDHSAKVLWSRGERGSGPGEYQRLRSAVRLTSGDIVALDNSGKLVQYDADGNLKTTYESHLSPTYGAKVLDDSTLLISGRNSNDPDSPLLHLWDLKRNTIRSSLFRTPPHPPAFDGAYRFNGWANAIQVGNDSLAIIFALSDTLYLQTFSGAPIAKLPLHLRGFRPIREPAPRNESPEAEIAWANSFTSMSDIFPGPGHSVLVQYYNEEQVEQVWGLANLVLTDKGLLRRFDIPRSYRLLGVARPTDDLVFLRSDLLESVTWSFGHLVH